MLRVGYPDLFSSAQTSEYSGLDQEAFSVGIDTTPGAGTSLSPGSASHFYIPFNWKVLPDIEVESLSELPPPPRPPLLALVLPP